MPAVLTVSLALNGKRPCAQCHGFAGAYQGDTQDEFER